MAESLRYIMVIRYQWLTQSLFIWLVLSTKCVAIFDREGPICSSQHLYIWRALSYKRYRTSVYHTVLAVDPNQAAFHQYDHFITIISWHIKCLVKHSIQVYRGVSLLPITVIIDRLKKKPLEKPTPETSGDFGTFVINSIV